MLFIDSYKGTNINDVGHQTLSDLRLLYISIVSNPIALNYQSRKIDFIFSFFFVFFLSNMYSVSVSVFLHSSTAPLPLLGWKNFCIEGYKY